MSRKNKRKKRRKHEEEKNKTSPTYSKDEKKAKKKIRKIFYTLILHLSGEYIPFQTHLIFYLKEKMGNKYNHQESEKKWQSFWEEKGIYIFSKDTDKPIYSIDTPPPTVS